MGDDETPGSVTGVWDGLYSYPIAFPSAPFTATLLEVGGTISGTTHEVAQLGPSAGALIHANVEGQHAGAEVFFVKRYDEQGSAGGYDAEILYDGVLSADGLEIEGRWSIEGVWSGKFLMVRAGRKSVAARQRAFAKA